MLLKTVPNDYLTVFPGATIVNSATLRAIADWYPELDTENTRRRLLSPKEKILCPNGQSDLVFIIIFAWQLIPGYRPQKRGKQLK